MISAGVNELQHTADQPLVGPGGNSERFQQQNSKDGPPAFAAAVDQISDRHGEHLRIGVYVVLPVRRSHKLFDFGGIELPGEKLLQMPVHSPTHGFDEIAMIEDESVAVELIPRSAAHGFSVNRARHVACHLPDGAHRAEGGDFLIRRRTLPTPSGFTPPLSTHFPKLLSTTPHWAIALARAGARKKQSHMPDGL